MTVSQDNRHNSIDGYVELSEIKAIVLSECLISSGANGCSL